jgi:hypothetical protein
MRSVDVTMVGPASSPEEYEDRWVLGYRDMLVSNVIVGERLTLMLNSRACLVLAGPAWLSCGSIRNDSSPRIQLIAPRWDAAEVLQLQGDKVLSAVAFKTGALRVVFSGGMHLNCKAHESSRAWETIGPGEWKFAALPATAEYPRLEVVRE